jgi:hypothetical protein
MIRLVRGKPSPTPAARQAPAPVERPAAARLAVELVPEPCWWSNVRTIVDPPVWDQLRRQVYRHAHYRCEICGDRGPEHPVEAHEVWSYDDLLHVQAPAGYDRPGNWSTSCMTRPGRGQGRPQLVDLGGRRAIRARAPAVRLLMTWSFVQEPTPVLLPPKLRREPQPHSPASRSAESVAGWAPVVGNLSERRLA